LQDCLNPWGIYEKSDSKAREKEGLTTHDSVLSGVIPERIRIEDAGASFFVGFQESQKTGFYLDQRRNRTIVAGYVEPGSRVLDVFSNTGGFGIHAALKGAESVRLVDISQKALQTARDNADLNGLRGIETVKADAFDYMTSQENAGSEYSMIVLDPPSFTGTSHSRRGAIRGFKRLVSGALGLLKPEGLLAVFSCSHHISMEDLNNIAKEASGNAGLRLRVAEQLFQDLDHPYIVNIPQSLYLKGILLQKV
jgi:23S rRNA (cytosine1962-C5)-methyltransferase